MYVIIAPLLLSILLDKTVASGHDFSSNYDEDISYEDILCTIESLREEHELRRAAIAKANRERIDILLELIEREENSMATTDGSLPVGLQPSVPMNMEQDPVDDSRGDISNMEVNGKSPIASPPQDHSADMVVSIPEDEALSSDSVDSVPIGVTEQGSCASSHCTCPSSSTITTMIVHMPGCQSQVDQMARQTEEDATPIDDDVMKAAIGLLLDDQYLALTSTKEDETNDLGSDQYLALTSTKEDETNDLGSLAGRELIRDVLKGARTELSMHNNLKFKIQLNKYISISGYDNRQTRRYMPMRDYISLTAYYISLLKMQESKQPAIVNTYMWTTLCTSFSETSLVELQRAIRQEPYATYFYTLTSSMNNEKEYLVSLSRRIEAKIRSDMSTEEMVTAAFRYFDSPAAKTFEETITNLNVIVRLPRYKEEILARLNAVFKKTAQQSNEVYFYNIITVLISKEFTDQYLDMLKRIRSYGVEHESTIGVHVRELDEILRNASNGIAEAMLWKSQYVSMNVTSKDPKSRVSRNSKVSIVASIYSLISIICNTVDKLEVDSTQKSQIKFEVSNTLLATINMIKSVYFLIGAMKGLPIRKCDVPEFGAVLENMIFTQVDFTHVASAIENVATAIGRNLGQTYYDRCNTKKDTSKRRKKAKKSS